MTVGITVTAQLLVTLQWTRSVLMCNVNVIIRIIAYKLTNAQDDVNNLLQSLFITEGKILSNNVFIM